MNDFVHLHVRTKYSFGEAMGSPKEYASAAKQHGQKALAITDMGNLSGVYDFNDKCNEQGIKPIFGQEFFVALNDDMTSKPSGENRQRRIVLLAKNLIGWKNICKLSSLANLKGRYYKPRIDSKCLREHKEGIIGLGCGLGGVVGTHWLQGDESKALEAARTYKSVLGDDFYLEVFPTNDQKQIEFNKFLMKVAVKDKIKIVAANQCLYVKQEQAKYYPYLLMIKNNQTKDEFESRGREFPDSLYLMSTEGMTEAFGAQGFDEEDYMKWILQAGQIAKGIEQVKFKSTFELPDFQAIKTKKKVVVEKVEERTLFNI